MHTGQNPSVFELPRFLVDQNVGKLARWLRLLGYDTAFFTGIDDNSWDDGR